MRRRASGPTVVSLEITVGHDDSGRPLPLKKSVAERRPSPAAELVELDETFRELAVGLLKREREILGMIYNGQGWTFKQVAERLGLSESRMSQIHATAIARIRRRRRRIGK